jgi:hypothetical protein
MLNGRRLMLNCVGYHDVADTKFRAKRAGKTCRDDKIVGFAHQNLSAMACVFRANSRDDKINDGAANFGLMNRDAADNTSAQVLRLSPGREFRFDRKCD